MIGFIKLAIRQHKASVALVLFVLFAGLLSRAQMTSESFPNVTIPVAFTQVVHQGISPEDGARLLARPLEQELKTIDGVVEMEATSREDVTYLIVEFQTNIDIDVALQNTREAVDRAKVEFPENTEEPTVEEVAAENSIVVVVTFSSDSAEEREVFQVAKKFQQRIEGLSDVLEAELRGAREEVAEVIIDPAKLDYYGIQVNELVDLVRRNNVLIPAGDLDSGYGNFGVKVPSLVETVDDLKRLPVRANENSVIRLDQIAEVRRTFKDPTGFSRVNGKPTIGIQISKRLKANTVDTVQKVRELVAAGADEIPANIDVEYVFDNSRITTEIIDELTGNIVSAMALVLVIVVAALGFRAGLLVGFGIPFSLLGAAIVVGLLDFSFNFMVIFGLLLSLGMLIDGALVVVEYASRQISMGFSAYDAYLNSVKRMAVPIIASTLTTLAAFLPLLFWPGVVGDFMVFLPTTVFAVLIWSLVFSLVVVPILGIRLRSRDKQKPSAITTHGEEEEEAAQFNALQNAYLSLLRPCIAHPVALAVATVVVLVGIYSIYGKFGPGTVFFTANAEDIFTQISIRAQGNLTIAEKAQMSRRVEERLNNVEEVKSYFISTGEGFGDSGAVPRDEIANVLLELQHPSDRELSSTEVLEKVRRETADLAGIIVQVNKIETGPPVGKDIQIELYSENREALLRNAARLRAHFDTLDSLVDVEDTLALPGIEWEFEVDKASAAMLGVNVQDVGQIVQMVTDGVVLGEYRPDDSTEEVEIRLRYPEQERGINAFDRLRVPTLNGSGTVPVSSFVQLQPKQRLDAIKRVDGIEVITVSAYTREGVLASNLIPDIRGWIEAQGIDDEVGVRYRGANEEGDESAAFLGTAFSLALILMLIILVAQFNSFYQSFLIISAVIMSTAGVLLGLLIWHVPFGIVMNGVGLVALAGIVVNNNIVLIDTYNTLGREHTDWTPSALAYEAAKLRFRPVLLTTLTTVIGMMPLANGASVDLLNRTIVIDGVVASFWQQMAATIVNGLTFSTVLTLLVTPAMLVLPCVLREQFNRFRQLLVPNSA